MENYASYVIPNEMTEDEVSAITVMVDIPGELVFSPLNLLNLHICQKTQKMSILVEKMSKDSGSCQKYVNEEANLKVYK